MKENFRPYPIEVYSQKPSAINTIRGNPWNIQKTQSQENLPKNNLIKEADSFRLGYDRETPRDALRDDVISYLNEYRLRVQKHEYTLLFSREADGLHIRDPHRGDAMVEAARRSLSRGDKYLRRVAELQGLEKEDVFLQSAQNGDLIIQASPPGPDRKEDGNYGFIFIKKIEVINEEEKILHNIALRVEDPTIDQYNKLLSDITGRSIEFGSAEEFIGSPFFLGGSTTEHEIEKKISSAFSFTEVNAEGEKNKSIISAMEIYIEGFIDMIKAGQDKADLLHAFYALENKAIELKNNYKTVVVNNMDTVLGHNANPKTKILFAPKEFQNFVQSYSYEPPKVGGSCGSSGGTTENFGSPTKTFRTGTSLNDILSGKNADSSEKFTCPKCDQSFNPPVGDSCPGCQYSKEQFKQDHPELFCA